MDRYKAVFKESVYGSTVPGTENVDPVGKPSAMKVEVEGKEMAALRQNEGFKEMLKQGRIKVKGSEIWYWSNNIQARATIQVTAGANL